MEVYDFLPTYTNFDHDAEEILGKDLVETTSLYNKKEFYDYRLKSIEERPKEAGVYMNHQIIISRFLSSNTPYRGILVMHEPGTGKTCLSVAVIEKIRSESSHFKGALILMNNPNLIKNYKKELTETCTPGTYKIEDIDEKTELKLNPRQIKIRMNKKLAQYYQFETIETFTKNILANKSNEEIKKDFSNRIIIIDEAHHLRVSNDKELEGQYNNIHRLLHNIENSKIILMTGTPMVDNASEIASLMNLILDEKNQLPIGETFIKEYMKQIGKDIYVMKDDVPSSYHFKELLHGKVSFLRSMQSGVKRQYIGEKLDLIHFNQYVLPLQTYQLEHYINALETDEEKKGDFYIKCRQAALFVYPDGTYGKKGYENYTSKITVNKVTKLKIKPNFFNELFGNAKSKDEKLEKLKNYSIKYASCIEKLLNDEGNHFVYLEFVHGSGAIIFTAILEQFGFYNFKDKKGKGSNYALLTSETGTDIDESLKIFNSDANVMGKEIKVIIGTKIISEGFTLKNVQHVHILTPHWNFSEIDQTIARAFRLSSHAALEKLLKEDINVKIYLYTTVTNETLSDTSILSIDRYMYKFCEDKDIAIKSVEHVLKQISFDCRLNKERNRLPNILDNSRNCEYEKCDYVCYDEHKNELDVDLDLDIDIDDSTYHMFYDQPDINKMIKYLQSFFMKKSHCTLEELLKDDIFSNSSKKLILKSILYMISHKVIVNTHHGINYFLFHDNDIIFLSPKIRDNEWFDSFYVKHVPLQLYETFNNIVTKTYNNYLPILFQQLKEYNKKSLLYRFNEDAKELLLEIAILSRERGYENISSVREYIIDQFSGFINQKKDDNLFISSLLTYQLRCLDTSTLTNEWKDCDETIQLPKSAVKKIEYELNEYGYVGLYKYDKKDPEKKEFKIIKQQNKNEITKESGKNTGIVCKTMDKDELLDIIINRIKLEPTKKSEYTSLSMDQLREKIKTYKNTKDLDSKQFSQLTKEDLVKILYWSDLTKPQLCAQIEAFFEKNSLFIES